MNTSFKTNKSVFSFVKGKIKITLALDTADGYSGKSAWNELSYFSLSGLLEEGHKNEEDLFWKELDSMLKEIWNKSSAYSCYAIGDKSGLFWDIQGGGPYYASAVDINEKHHNWNFENSPKNQNLHAEIHRFYWFNIFGKTFSDYFGEKLLLSLPTYKTEKVKNGVIVQLAP